jgi:hypothetical protein
MPRSPGRKPWKPNDEQRMFVTANSGRATQETIAKVLGITVDTLFKHCRKELEAGIEVADALVEGAMFRECMKGNPTLIIWRDKTRRRMREVTAHEHSGPGGAPIEHRDMSRYTDDQLDILAKAATLLGGAVDEGGGESGAPAGVDQG